MGPRWSDGLGWLACAALATVAVLGACSSESNEGAGASSTGAMTTTTTTGTGASSTTTGSGATGGSGAATSTTTTSNGGGGSGGAPSCLPDKFELTQENGDAFDFYELCVLTDEMPAAETALQGIDATIHCDVQGAWAQCESAYETGCHGDLAFEGAGPAISDAKWDELCEMSLFDYVSTIAGGHVI